MKNNNNQNNYQYIIKSFYFSTLKHLLYRFFFAVESTLD